MAPDCNDRCVPSLNKSFTSQSNNRFTNKMSNTDMNSQKTSFIKCLTGNKQAFFNVHHYGVINNLLSDKKQTSKQIRMADNKMRKRGLRFGDVPHSGGTFDLLYQMPRGFDNKF